MIQNPITQTPAYTAPQPTYNAVKIDINNPQVNAPNTSQNQPSAPVYTAPIYGSVPTASAYEVPTASIYENKQNFNQPPIVKETPSAPVPAPVVVTQAAAPVTQPIAPVAAVQPVEVKAPEAKPEAVEVKTPEAAKPQVDLNAFLAKLSSADYEEQASAMEAIAELAQSAPQKATELLDVKVVDSLLGIMQKDSSQLTGPTPQQLQIREKIINGQTVSDADKAEANKISPMEQSERNKQYAIYTVAILQKLYGTEIQKMNNTVVPLTELPGAAGIVEQVKNNPNPMVRASAIDALSYIQCPEYKQDLNTLFTVAKNDKDPNVKQIAAKALEKLAQLAEVQPKEAAAPAVAAPKAAEVKA